MQTRRHARAAVVIGIVAVTTATAFAQEPAAPGLPGARIPGAQSDGSVVLPNQWSLRPVGRQIEVGDFPAAIALHPDGRHAVVLHCGYGPHELAVIDVEERRVLSRTRVEESFQGIAFLPGGSRLVVSGGAAERLLLYRFEGGVLVPDGAIPLRDEKVRGIPCGIAVGPDGRVYVANVWGHSLSVVEPRTADGQAAVGPELLLSDAAPAAPPATPPTTDDPSITKRADVLLERIVADAPYPWTCLVDAPRQRLYVSLWAQAAVAVIDIGADGWKVVGRWNVEEHPNEMVLTPDGRRLFVANANRNSVSVIDPDTGAVAETLVATLTPDAPPGNTPNSLAISPDGARLYVSNANINALSVWDIAEPGRSRSLGFIPVGWYPTCVRITADGRRLLVANGKGVISDSNRNGPRPGFNPDAPTPDYIGGLFDGTVSFIDLPADDEAGRARLAEWTERAFACRPPAADDVFTADELAGHPIPLRPGAASPITHVIYVVKENRTYDQVLGDMPEGRGDPTLCLFPERVTPNHHALAREFVLLDNFYVESEVSADGHEWSMGAYASDFVERHWPLSYGHNRRKKFPYPAEGSYDAVARPAGGYLWDRAIAAGVSFRSYGEWVANGPTPDAPCTPKVPALEGRFDPLYRSFDQDYSDLKRADRFIAELARFEREGEMPRLQIVRLPNDHTSGSSPGKLTPTAFMAENDLAFGRIVEAVSRSRYWPTTAIFVVEDDAQNGSDHVDAHRTIAFVISPWARRGAVDSSLYSTSSMLRTMELILGLEPMSQFDAAALPMVRSFAKTANPAPYACRPATARLDERNLAGAWGAEASLAMDFSVEDAADDLLLNEIVWRSVRGADSPMPPPRRAAFVFASDDEEEDDDGTGGAAAAGDRDGD
ncbi:MAG: bifunctional YncE family protein/alkaline phosphatase family protein [Planctomycetaceae bacterium]